MRHLALLVLFFCLLPIPGIFAQSAEVVELRQRVAGRAPVILRLKNAGLVREAANGFLEPTTQLTQADAQAVQSENRDRASAFSLLGLKNNLPSSEVQSMFAAGARGSTPSPAVPASSPATTPSAAPSTPGVSPVAPVAPTPSSTLTPAPVVAPTPAIAPQTVPPVAPVLPPPEGLPAKVLNRPAASLYESPATTATRLRENLPGFLVYYVVGERDGWLQVSTTEGGAPAGWLQAGEVIPWRHNLAVRFAHEGRGNRRPVPFFGEMTALESALRLDEAARRRLAESAAGVPDATAAREAGVVAVQPDLVDRNQFYVLPILEHRAVKPREFSALRGEGRLLRVAALRQAAASRTPAAAAGDRPALDLVFVMDLTSSMKPFVDQTLTAVDEISRKLAAGGLSNGVRFGFWGYRDRAPDQDFGDGQTTKNFTPQLQEREAFIETLRRVEVSSSSAGDYAEAVFYGVGDALGKTAWTPGAMRVVVLIGDAASHPPGHEKNPDNLSEGTLRALANAGEQPVYILPVYILRDSPLAAEDARVARVQFRELGRNPNVAGEGLLLEIGQGNSEAEFGAAIRGTLDQLVNRLESASDFEAHRRGGAAVATGASDSPATPSALADSLFAGAYLDWLAARPEAGSPVGDSLAGWAADKDLAAPEIQALDVVFLMTKSQLDTLVRLLNQVVDAGVRSRVRGTNFFSTLQSIVGRAAVDPANLGAGGLNGAALTPDFLKVLPYQSELLTLSQDEWRGMSAADQTAFLDRLNSNIHFYTDLARDPAKWHPLNPEDNREAHVTAVPLDRLP